MCAIKDLWSNRIIGYPIDSRMTVELAVAAVGSAVALQDVDEKILHSDRGPRTADRGLGPGNSLNYDGTKASSARWGGSGQAVTTPQRRLGRPTPIEFEVIDSQAAHAV